MAVDFGLCISDLCQNVFAYLLPFTYLLFLFSSGVKQPYWDIKKSAAFPPPFYKETLLAATSVNNT